MIVCDICKSVKKPASQCYVALLKDEDRKGRIVERTMKKLSVHLCEECITDMIHRVAKSMKTDNDPTISG